MKAAPTILIAALALSLAGCAAKAKPAPPAPPAPQPLSLPQTQVQLPPAQPVDPQALAPAPPAEAPPPSRTTTRTRPAPPAAPQEAERGPARELLDPVESARLRNSADAHKREVRAWLNGSQGRRLDPNNPTLARIKLLLKTSDEAEQKGDIREASDLADRAVTFMRELQSVR
jgi:type IV secretory pathway VirB10-like protein